MMPALAEYLVDARQSPVDPFHDRFATKPEPPSPGRRAIVREAQEVECFRLARPALAPVQLGEPAKLHEAGLVQKVSLWLGHSSVQTTEMYLQADPTDKLDTLDKWRPPSLRKGRFKGVQDELLAMLAGT